MPEYCFKIKDFLIKVISKKSERLQKISDKEMSISVLQSSICYELCDVCYNRKLMTK